MTAYENTQNYAFYVRKVNDALVEATQVLNAIMATKGTGIRKPGQAEYVYCQDCSSFAEPCEKLGKAVTDFLNFYEPLDQQLTVDVRGLKRVKPSAPNTPSLEATHLNLSLTRLECKNVMKEFAKVAAVAKTDCVHSPSPPSDNYVSLASHIHTLLSHFRNVWNEYQEDEATFLKDFEAAASGTAKLDNLKLIVAKAEFAMYSPPAMR